MATTVATVNTGHADIIHDAQFDFYGRKFATCSSDRTVRVFDVIGSETSTEPACIAELIAHEGPVWQVAWSHPQYGSILASCGYDRRIILHRETAQGVWTKLHAFEGHASSVNSVAFAPQEYGLELAACSSDGRVSVLTHREDDSWSSVMLDACPLGCNAVSWAPAHHIGSRDPVAAAAGMDALTKRLAVACSDKCVRVFACRPGGDWALEHTLRGHSECVRDVAFSPAGGVTDNILASADDDGHVFMWRNASAGGEWLREELPPFSGPVWRVSWNVTGTVCAVTSGDSDVTLWKVNIHGAFQQISTVPELPITVAAGPQ